MLRTGHEGPYSLESLIQRKIAPEMKVWAEGLTSPVTLKVAVDNSREIVQAVSEEDEIPPLPPLPQKEEEEIVFIPPIPESETQELQAENIPVPDHAVKIRLGLALGILLILVLGLKEWVKSQEHFSINRAPGMSTELFQKISNDFKFEAWGRKIFLKEYVPADMSHIWLVTSSFQTCQVEASFSSVKGKLLAVNDEKVSFKTSSKIKKHVAEFSSFDFTSGNKILPGLYEMDLKATSCEWDGLASKLGNFFKSPDPVYITRMKVVLFHKGSVEFNTILDKLIRKKLDFEMKNQNQEELFWQDLQQKLQTLLAMTLQIEQLLLEFVEKPPGTFKTNLKVTVDKYTKKFGSTLTEFVVQNEKYFSDLEKSELPKMSKKRSYEAVIRVTSKNIGLESMKIIEQLQSWKNPSGADLGRMESRIKKQFDALKNSLNQRIIQLTEDRTK
jgi:hypothetical protein